MESTFAQLTAETIINGFRASGIFPWNAENINYSKCLGQENPVISNETVSNDESIIISHVPTDHDK